MGALASAPAPTEAKPPPPRSPSRNRPVRCSGTCQDFSDACSSVEKSSCKITIFCLSSSSRCRASCGEGENRSAGAPAPPSGSGLPLLGGFRQVFGFCGLPVGISDHGKIGYVTPLYFNNNYNFKSAVALTEDPVSRWVRAVFGAYLQVVGQLHHFLKGKGSMFRK